MTIVYTFAVGALIGAAIGICILIVKTYRDGCKFIDDFFDQQEDLCL